MGFDFNTTKFVLFGKSLGIDFSEVATLGRQILFIHEKELAYLLREFSYPVTDAEVKEFYEGSNLAAGKYPYAEPLLRYLGARNTDSVDASAYEGATIIHDMNLPIDERHWSKHSVVIDGGTLEHIFNLPVAFQNAMNILRKGGHFISIGPANNWLGHGLYQFSPELFHRVFNEKNGFRIKGSYLADVKSRKYWHEITDPDRRLALVTSSEVYLMVIAEKIAEVASIDAAPQQSYYEDKLWSGDSDAALDRWLAFLEKAKKAIPIEVINRLVPLRARLKSLVARPYDVEGLRRFDPVALQGVDEPDAGSLSEKT